MIWARSRSRCAVVWPRRRVTYTRNALSDLVATLAVTERADLTDAQWAVLEPLLPARKRLGRPPKWTKRQLIDGI